MLNKPNYLTRIKTKYFLQNYSRSNSIIPEVRDILSHTQEQIMNALALSGGGNISRHEERIARTGQPLSDVEIARAAPSVFAETAHASRSDRYTYLATSTVLHALRDAGFLPYYAAQANNRLAGRLTHARHILRFRHPDMKQSGDGMHEIILVNSHDGSSAYQLISGYYRLVCSNGLCLAHAAHDVRISHKGNKLVDDIIDVAYRIVSEQETRIAALDDMRATKMPYDRQIAFAREATVARFGENGMQVDPVELLRARRFDDGGDNEWIIYNRVQENLTRGDFNGKTINGKNRKVSSIRAANKDFDFNRKLWGIFEQYRKDGVTDDLGFTAEDAEEGRRMIAA
jgi:hypothetical protein